MLKKEDRDMLERWENQYLDPDFDTVRATHEEYEVYYDRYGKKHYYIED